MQVEPRVTVWNEFHHERYRPESAAVYPHGIHVAIRDGLVAHGFADVRTATLDEPEHGLTQAVLDATDVLVWWGHVRHDDVADSVVERVKRRVWAGMGLVVLHSGHYSKIFRALTGTPSDVTIWNEDGERERIVVVSPGHPIAAGLGRFFEIEMEESYAEPMEVPNPTDLIFVSWFQGGEVFRSGCTYTRGRGRIFYFRPGHETFPTYFIPEVRRVIANGVRWAAPEASRV
jgi:trehalose utilization protein